MGYLRLKTLPKKWIGLFLLTSIMTCSYFVAMNYFAIDLRPLTLYYSIWDPVGNRGNGVTWRQLALQVSAVKHELEVARINGKPPSVHAITELEKILGQLDSELFVSASFEDNNSSSALAVCPEMYTNGTYGWPFYETGWITTNCSEVLPIHEVISVVLKPSLDAGGDCFQYLNWTLQGLRKLYPTVTVYVADQGSCRSISKHYPNVHLVPISSSATASSMWTSLISSVTTPYVFVAHDVFHFTSLTNLERQIRVVSYNKRIRVAGGAMRNGTGHWKIGCFQTSMRNYVLEVVEGYHISKNECMFCDHLAGPFVARTEVFSEILLDKSLPEELVFLDFFLQVKNAGYLVVNCPDVMYFANDKHNLRQSEKSIWSSLVKKWELNYVLLPKRVKYTFSCSESGISCKFMMSKVRSYLLPPCCLSQFVTGLKVLRDLGVSFEVDSGTVLGAVKMQENIPWDIDADTIYLTANHSFLLSAKEHIAKLGLQLVEHDPVSKGGYFMLWTPDGGIEMYGTGLLSSSTLLPPELRSIPTKVELDGEWFDAPTSPGLYARSRYGPGILKHAQSWRHQGLKSSFAKYRVGTFLPCQKTNHHACLDRFAGDGNIQFKIP